MSKKSRERREKHKAMRPDDYYTNGAIEMAQFGKNTIIRNNRTEAQQAEYVKLLSSEYPARYQAINEKIEALKKKVVKCDPYGLLLYLRSMALSTQINLFSEIQLYVDGNAIVRAQEYVQSIIVSVPNEYNPSESDEDQQALYEEILSDYEYLSKELMVFYIYWSAHTEKTKGIHGERLNDIVESQYMYWVRGNRYQVFELEPLRDLLPPHDSVLQELFGVTATEIISGLEKLQYSLSQGYADAMMDFGDNYQSFLDSVGDGMTPDAVMESTRGEVEPVVNKLFGDGLIDVSAITGWDARFIDALSLEVGADTSFFDDQEFSGWPIVELPVMKKPFIKLNGKTYAFLYYALFDNIYRNIQKNITGRKSDYLDTWKLYQTQISEEMVRDLFLKILPGAEAHIGNYYPVKNSLKQMNENDIIIVYHNYLFVIEVKAGSFPNTPPITDFNAHISAYHSLAEVADNQCSRTLDYIASRPAPQFYTKDKVLKFGVGNLTSFDDVFTFSVTVDNFNEFAAKAEKLSVISLKRQTVVISFDDLLVYAGYFDSPVRFLHYLKQRKAAMAVPQFQMHDEFDHLGLYIDRNLYAMNPSQYGDVQNVFWQGFREEIDDYFNMLYVAPEQVSKPEQKIEGEFREILDWIDTHISPENIRLAHFLLDLSNEARAGLSDQIKYVIRRQREINCQIPIAAFGDIKYCVFVSTPDVPSASADQKRDYVYSIASRNEAIPVMRISIEYDEKATLVNVSAEQCYFSDLRPDEYDRIRALGQKNARDWVMQAKSKNGKVGRNDYCPCGSGKKFKFCCLGNE